MINLQRHVVLSALSVFGFYNPNVIRIIKSEGYFHIKQGARVTHRMRKIIVLDLSINEGLLG